MPIVSIGFSPLDDIHVMRGRSSRPLFGALFIVPTKDVNDGKPFFATDAAKLTQAGGANVNVTFSITFPNTNAHGVQINTGTLPTPANPAGVHGTGVVQAAALPLPASYPRNFIVTAQVLGTPATPADPVPTFRTRIRVHVHNSVTAVVLSPPSLTARQEPAPAAASRVGFTVLAQFDDQVLANITDYGDPAVPATRINWQTTTPALLNIDAGTGMITALTSAAGPPFGSVQAVLPAELGFPGPNPTGAVNFAAGWSTQRTAKPVPGTTARIPHPDQFNLLLLPDGFRAGEQGRFEAFARNLLKKWKDTPAVAPFGMMPLNAFTVWVESADQGTTVRNPLFYNNRTAGSQTALALQQVPPAGVPQTLAELVYVVGLPTIAEAATPFGTKQGEWTTLYGAAAIAGVNPTLHTQWTAISDYVLAAETDTAFGSATGRSPHLLFVDDGRIIEWHPRRAQRTDVDKMLKALVDEHGNPVANVVDATGTVVGNVWTAPLPANGRQTIGILASGGRSAGAGTKSVELGGPGEMIFSSLSNDPAVPLANVVGGRNFPSLRPYPLPAHLQLTTIARVTHELGHGLTLADEYGGTHQAEGFKRDFARANYANVQDEADVTDPATGLISGSRILWQSWPRISAAGLVIADVTGVNPNYDVTLRPGHGDLFFAETPTIPGDTVRLRKRPFYAAVGSAPNVHVEYLPESIDFTVKTITKGPAGDVLRIVRVGTGPFNLGDYKANKAILFSSQGTLKMMHPAVVQSINTRHLPLNRLFQGPPNSPPSCFDDHLVRQGYPNSILGIKDRKPRAWVVGLCDGGAEFYCGMFHPRGTCMMRALQVDYTQPNVKKKKGFLYDFCPICRYIIVDKIDPSLHGKMDQLYEKIYPVAQ